MMQQFTLSSTELCRDSSLESHKAIFFRISIPPSRFLLCRVFQSEVSTLRAGYVGAFSVSCCWKEQLLQSKFGPQSSTTTETFLQEYKIHCTYYKEESCHTQLVNYFDNYFDFQNGENQGPQANTVQFPSDQLKLVWII